MAFERVVCLVDGSDDGLEALRQAAVLRDPGGELLGVVTCDLGVAAEAGYEAKHAARQLEEEALLARDAAAAELRDFPSASVEIATGRLAPALLGVVTRRNADLLVLGTHRSSRRRGLIVGSFITEMIHRAPAPVLVARGAADGGAWLPRTLTVGVDASECSLDALGVARALADRLDARVRVLAATGGKRVDPENLRSLGDVEWDERPPVGALVAASESSDLVVVGSHGLHGLASLGSVSERVAHRAVCSVLVVRGQAAEHRSITSTLSVRVRPRRRRPHG